KALMQKVGVPVVSGYHGARQGRAFLKEKAYEIGYPVLIKAVAGGGGKGMRRVDAHADFEAALEGAEREAQAAFGNPRVLLEKYIASPRHIEMQIFADDHGNIIHLFERDCSLQRRHQKVIEEAPAPGMTRELRELMGRAAVEAARAVGYRGAGTVEFIVDSTKGLRPDGFYFMEMNTRLQVEHPVTEMITGLDLVELQFRVAAGEALPLGQSQVRSHGHAIEARLYAEDPERGFLPSSGRLWALRFPEFEDIRIDTGFEEHDDVSPFYDPLLAKVIACGTTRPQAINHLVGALGKIRVAGPRSNLAFLKALASAPEFRAEHFDTGFIDRALPKLAPRIEPFDAEAARLGILKCVSDLMARRPQNRGGPSGGLPSPWDALDGFQLGEPRSMMLPAIVDDETVEARIVWPEAAGKAQTADFALELEGAVTRYRDALAEFSRECLVEACDAILVLRQGRQTSVRLVDPLAVDIEGEGDGDGVVPSPMHGKIVALLVKLGEAVAKGHRLAIVEAMKMEHALTAPRAGIVAEIAASAGDQVSQGAKVMVIRGEDQ
ncbi:MAG: carbamoyl-phosphate synthase subunit L, partial [Methylobacteriaceae bacterium]|nr:carbamoyl-phosphate synthase subunit L [Methylobacteriaceae bacterium]